MEEKYEVNGKMCDAVKVDMYGLSLMIIKGARGFLACGYINIAAAEKFNQAGAIVGGVKNYGDMIKAKVSAVSPLARSMGVSEGMSGLENI